MDFSTARQPNEVFYFIFCFSNTTNTSYKQSNVKNQVFTKWNNYCIIIFIIFFSCTQKKFDTPTYCELKLDPKAFDSIYLDVSLRSYFPYLDLSSNRVQQFYGNLKSIEEVTSTQELRFDENVEIPKSIIRYYFNDANLISKEEHFNALSNEALTKVTFTYNPQNKLIRREFSREEYNIIDYYSYNLAGLPYQQTTHIASSGKQVPKNPSSINFTQYNDQNQITQTKLVKFIPFNEIDSLVAKYSYDTKMRLSSIVFYNKDGQRQVYINVSFLEDRKQIKITSFNVQFYREFGNNNSDEDAKDEIVLGYSDNCQLSFITQVKKINSAEFIKSFKKIELNKYNEIVLMREYELKTPKDKSLNYVEDANYEGDNKKFEKFKYRYDSLGNWVEKIERGKITRRTITYK